MKLCKKEGCENQIDDKYEFCYLHYQSGKKTDMASKPGIWHDDPVVDALLKMNANFKKISDTLVEISETLRKE